MDTKEQLLANVAKAQVNLAKATINQGFAIRAAVEGGVSLRDIAARTDFSHETIRRMASQLWGTKKQSIQWPRPGKVTKETSD